MSAGERSGPHNCGKQEMPQQIREGMERNHPGQRPPINEAETYSEKVGQDTDYQFDSIMDDAYLGAAADVDTDTDYTDPKRKRLDEEVGLTVNRNSAADPRVVKEITGEEESPLEP